MAVQFAKKLYGHDLEIKMPIQENLFIYVFCGVCILFKRFDISLGLL